MSNDVRTMANKSVSLTGTNQDGDKFSVVLTIAGNKWTKIEPSGASKVFVTSSGVWSRASSVVGLFKSNGSTKVGSLKPLFPESAKKDETGSGTADETASSLSWTIDSVG